MVGFYIASMCILLCGNVLFVYYDVPDKARLPLALWCILYGAALSGYEASKHWKWKDSWFHKKQHPDDKEKGEE